MLNIVVCVSGGGTNLQAIIDAIDNGTITNTCIKAVISNNYGVYALERAKAAGVEFTTDAESFADDDQIADYAKEAVYALKNAGAVSGMTETEFSPQAGATRAQAAKIIYSLIK